MGKLKTDTMLSIWDELLRMFRMNDFELSKRVGLSSGAVGAWRTTNPKKKPETIRESTIRMIEESLKIKIKIDLIGENEWRIKRDVPQYNYNFSTMNDDLSIIIQELIEDGKVGRFDRIIATRKYYEFLKAQDAGKPEEKKN